MPPGEGSIRYEEVRAFIEYNAGAKDLGFHVEFNGEPWTSAKITDPNGHVVFDLTTDGSLTRQGLASAFFESGEYGFDEVSREEFLARFPEGTYTFVGRTVDGRTLTNAWAFSHLIPGQPSITSPAGDAPVDRDAVTIAWEAVTTPVGVEVEAYRVQVYPVDPPKGKPPIHLNIDYTLEVPATVHTVHVPPEILMPGADYEFEVTIVDGTRNQTFAVGKFTTSG